MKWRDDEVARKEKRSKRGDSIATTQIAGRKKEEEGKTRKKKGKGGEERARKRGRDQSCCLDGDVAKRRFR